MVKVLFIVMVIGSVNVRANSVAAPIVNFHTVEPGVYRGARPLDAGLLYLADSGVRTVLDVEDDDFAVAEEQAVAEKLGLQFYSTPMSGFWTPHQKQVNQSLAILANQSLRPIYIHCLHGQDRTGLLVALYRVFYESWTPAKAWTEAETLGFHDILFLLKGYFEKATGWDG